MNTSIPHIFVICNKQASDRSIDLINRVQHARHEHQNCCSVCLRETRSCIRCANIMGRPREKKPRTDLISQLERFNQSNDPPSRGAQLCVMKVKEQVILFSPSSSLFRRILYSSFGKTVEALREFRPTKTKYKIKPLV
jgi:hypothetical protein